MTFIPCLATLPLPLADGFLSSQIDLGEMPIPPLNSSDTVIA